MVSPNLLQNTLFPLTVFSYFRGGLKVGDIITHINGVAVTCPADLYGGTSEKKTIELELIQQGKKVRILIQPEMFDGEDW